MKVDPRWYVLSNNSALLLLGIALWGLQRDWVQVAFCLAMGSSTELLAAFAFKKHARVRVADRLLSAAVASISTVVLVRAGEWWFYGLLVSLAIVSKYVLVDAEGRHVFNPTNFAIVFSLAFLPDHLFVRPDQFSFDQSTFYVVLPMVGGFGALAMAGANRWRGTLAYYLTILCAGVPLGAALGLKPLWVLAPEMNISTLIFAFLMMTDPRTTPTPPGEQWLFGGAVALLHLALRYKQVPYSPFVSLFIITGFWSLFRTAMTAARSRTWAPATAEIITAPPDANP